MQLALSKRTLYGIVGALLLMATWQMGEQAGRSQGAVAASPAVTQQALMHVFAYTPVAGATQASSLTYQPRLARSDVMCAV